MTSEPNNDPALIAAANAVIAARKDATRRGTADARKVLAEKQQRAAMRTATPGRPARAVPVTESEDMTKIERLTKLLAKLEAGKVKDIELKTVVVTDTDGSTVRLDDPRAADAIRRRIAAEQPDA